MYKKNNIVFFTDIQSIKLRSRLQKMATTQGEIRVGPGNQVKDIYVR